MRILAIDPGPVKSGYVFYAPDEAKPIVGFYWMQNESLLFELSKLPTHIGWNKCHVIIEAASDFMGRLYNRDMALTSFWWGRFTQRAIDNGVHESVGSMTARDVRRNLCGSAGIKEKTTKQGVIDYFGGNTRAIGGVRCPKCKGKGWFGPGRNTCPQCSGSKWEQPPGVLYEVKRNGNQHVWSALALAVTYADQNKEA